MLVLIKGAGDLATGVAVRLWNAGLDVIMTDLGCPTAVRRTVSFCQAVYDGQASVEGLQARQSPIDEAHATLSKGQIPVLLNPSLAELKQLTPNGLVDAVMAKRNSGTRLSDAPVVIGLGPGFTAGEDCHAVVETARGHDLGRLLLQGSALPNTGVPGLVGGYGTERLLRAPKAGLFKQVAAIGDIVKAGDVVATVNGAPVKASIDGILRGLLPDGLEVTKGMKAGDVDPRCRREHCFTVSDKARAVGGSVLEGLMYFWMRQNRPITQRIAPLF